MVKSKIPPKSKLTFFEQIKLGLMALIQIVLWVSMIFASINVLLFWAYNVLTKGIADPSTIQYSIIIAVGAYFCLIIDKDKIYEALKIKKVPFITAKTNK